MPQHPSALPGPLVRAVAALLALLVAVPALAGQVLVDVLDVGQGDAVLIRGGGKAVLIDAGPRGGGVLDQLRTLRVKKLDLVVSSHPHADHIGDMAEVVRRLEVGLFLDNGMVHTTRTYATLMSAIEARGIRYRTAEAGLTLNLGDEATFTVLFPTGDPLRETRSDLNANSVVLRLDHGDVSFLFTGDAEAVTEQALIASGLQPVDVLKVPHHGSAHSSTARFLDATRPRYALISCGATNRYGHPAPDALGRLERAGAMVYRTDVSGNLRVISDGVDVEVLEGSLAELERVRVRQGEPTPVAERPAPPLSRKEIRKQARAARREARRAR